MIAHLFLVVPACIIIAWAAGVWAHRRVTNTLAEAREWQAIRDSHGWSTETPAVTVLRALPADLDVPDWPALRPVRSEHPSTGEAS